MTSTSLCFAEPDATPRSSHRLLAPSHLQEAEQESSSTPADISGMMNLQWWLVAAEADEHWRSIRGVFADELLATSMLQKAGNLRVSGLERGHSFLGPADTGTPQGHTIFVDLDAVAKRVESWLCVSRPTEARPAAANEERSFLALASRLGAFTEVRSIYVQHYRQDVQVFVMLSVSEYDFELMDQLLDAEWGVRQSCPGLSLEVTYHPGATDERPDMVHPLARCIFRR